MADLRPLRFLVVDDNPHMLKIVRTILNAFSVTNIYEALSALDVPVKLYGQGERPTQGNIEFCKVSESRFVADLASARAVIASAGNQLSGEAAYFGKSMFALPEPGQFEQEINAYYVKAHFGGEFSLLKELRPSMLQDFLKRAQSVGLREEIRANEDALEAIESFASRSLSFAQ